MQMALYPLAVPYLLNPAGIAAIVIASSEADSLAMTVILIGLVLLVGLIDWLVFSNMDRLARHLDPSRLAVTEAVFGVLLAALAVQLMLDGLAELGIISMLAH
jgi:multiple antibiotic resistance protein